MSFDVLSHSPAETGAFAVALAPLLAAGDVVLLDGDLAAGKTLFVSALARVLGADDAVTSPTFAIAQFYGGARGPILHMDAYRLEDLAAFRDLALDDYFPDAITLIEWGERVAAGFPDHLSIRFAIDGDARTLTFSAHGARWTKALSMLRAALPC
jgi:tRNA threonylcarbamoyladenosine biosynthesis protein TsaE